MTMRLSNFRHLLRDCELVAKEREAEAELVFVEAATLAAAAAAAVTSPDAQKYGSGDSKQLTFEAFCYALSRVTSPC